MAEKIKKIVEILRTPNRISFVEEKNIKAHKLKLAKIAQSL